MKSKIVIYSGFQTGADIAGIKAARNKGLETKGYMPKGYLTEKGNKPQYKECGAIETSSTNYTGRTLKNVMNTDCTIIFDEANSGGSKLTKNYCMKQDSPYLYFNKVKMQDSTIVQTILDFIINNDYKVINIAGNRESRSKGIEKRVYNILNKVFKQLK